MSHCDITKSPLVRRKVMNMLNWRNQDTTEPKEATSD